MPAAGAQWGGLQCGEDRVAGNVTFPKHGERIVRVSPGGRDPPAEHDPAAIELWQTAIQPWKISGGLTAALTGAAVLLAGSRLEYLVPLATDPRRPRPCDRHPPGAGALGRCLRHLRCRTRRRTRRSGTPRAAGTEPG